MDRYVIGLDYGTDSVRALVVNADTGQEAASGVCYYPRWKENLYCEPSKNMFRQHPLDYLEGLEKSVREALADLPDDLIQNIVGISVDTTGSTPAAVDRTGTPLALKAEFADNPNAMFVLWKDHTAVKEADEINRLAKNWGGTDYTKYEGGIYSSEWFWAKLLHVMREDKKVRDAAWTWLEHCDWIPAMLTGISSADKIKRSRCAAGHKAMWHAEWNGLPSEEFLVKLDPMLEGLRSRLYRETYTSDTEVGTLNREWAERLGLPENIKVGVGAFDAHLGAVGGEVRPYYLSKVMGTSTCDMVTAPSDEFGDKLVAGICGQVDGSIIPGMVGLEAGQSAFGDVYAWFRNLLLWPVKNILQKSKNLTVEEKNRLQDEITENMIEELSKSAASIDPSASGLLAIDWLNGRRTPDANPLLKGAVTGITLGTDAPAFFRALVEATAFGSKVIIDRFIEEGVRIDGVVALGGVAKKSEFVMQIVTDVLNMPVSVVRSEQTCALGSAMAASVVAGIHENFEKAQNSMGSGFEKEYLPRPDYVAKYEELYKKYLQLAESIEKMY